MPPYEANQMPMKFFLKFFQNHDFFKLKKRPQWYTVSNRSRTYVHNILSKMLHYKNYKVNKIKVKIQVDLYYGGENEFFDYDKVILATHADEALSIMKIQQRKKKPFYQNLVIKKILPTFIQMKH